MSIPVIVRFPRPVPGMHRAAGKISLALAIAREAISRPERVSPVVNWVDRLLLTLALACVAVGLLSCSPEPRPPLPDLTVTLGELERAHESVWPVEVEVCVRHGGGRCLHRGRP